MKNKKHARRVKRLALICTLCTVILVVSTYAWFIGMRTVSVSPFDVEIAATKGLYLSINGEDWYETIQINKDNFSTAYTGNTNTWSQGGLIPISSVGEIDSNLSRLVMFEKGSLTTTEGGYRLMASRLKNYTEDSDGTKSVPESTPEGKGFVAFDLFIKNLSGEEYYTEYNQLNEEAIYLTQNSEAVVKSNGDNDPQKKTGIENSVRVAFAQIGRVTAETTSATDIQKISCTSGKIGGTGANVTGICDRYAQIWEPNDTKHVDNAINWYKTSCVKRIGDKVTDAASYTGECAALTNGKYSKTYAVGETINYTNNIDVYDGLDYNTYYKSIGNYTPETYDFINGESTIADTNSGTIYAKKGIGQISENNTGKLYAYDYFTDTEKMLTGMDRPTFMTLAPNSITKVRVYIWLEGQDIDNYDFASLGKQIIVNFGFTKERFYNTDIKYDGPLTSENGAVPVTPETYESGTPKTVESSR